MEDRNMTFVVDVCTISNITKKCAVGTQLRAVPAGRHNTYNINQKLDETKSQYSYARKERIKWETSRTESTSKVGGKVT